MLTTALYQGTASAVPPVHDIPTGALETVSRPEIIFRGGTNIKKSGSFSREAAAFVLGVGVSPRSKWDNK